MAARRTTATLAAGLLVISIAAAAISMAMFDPSREQPREDVGTTRTAPLPGTPPAIEQAPGRQRLGELERLIRAFGEQTERAPNSTGLAFLGRLELERARLTGDAGSYARAERALKVAYELAPADFEIGTLLATVRYTTHDFTGALQLADTIYSEGREPGALAIRGDAALELGAYERASADYEALAGLLPESASVSARLARLAFLQGRAADAERLASEAETLAGREGAFGPKLAFYRSLRGRLALDAGRYDEASRYYLRAVEAAPDYHVSIAGLASARAAQGRTREAIKLYRRAVRIVPEPASVAALGDLYTLIGRDDLARQQYGTVDVIAKLAETKRLYDRQVALFYADHDRRLDDALEIAQSSLETRKDVYGYDTLAWVLYRLGRYDEAREASDRAVALGTLDARLWYHAGVISAALGDDDRALDELSRSIGLSPSFDPMQAPLAHEALDSLETGR